MTTHKINVFDRLNLYIRGTEGSLVNLLSAIAPWGAPLIPATMVYYNLRGQLGMEQWISLVAAAVVEILGLTTVSTAMVFWQSNRRERAGYKKMPVWVPVACFAWYLSVTITVNVLLEAPWSATQLVYVKLIARTLLTTLSIPAAVTLAIRAIHEAATRKIMAEGLENDQKMTGNLPEIIPTQESAKWNDWRKLPVEDRALVATMATFEIVQKYGVSDRTARNWRKAARNGHG